MAFTLNAGEFDLGGGCIGRGTILAGEAYSNTSLQNLLNTAGLEGLANVSTIDTRTANVVFFRESNDILSSSISLNPFLTDYFLWDMRTTVLDHQSRFYIATSAVRSDNNTNIVWSGINSSTSNTLQAVVPQIYSFEDNFNTSSSNWRFLARDHATAITHYPSTAIQGSIFAASYVNSSTQWGLWAAGAVGNRNGYFNQRQGDFAIVLLQDGANTYFSVMTTQAENSSTRNDSVIRSPNITPAPGQTGDDRFSELYLIRNQGNGYSEPLGQVPGFIYVDMNRSENASLAVGSLLRITPGVGTVYERFTNAIVVARWGLDLSLTISNVNSTFTVNTASTPTSATLSAGNRTRTTLETGQRIRFTATPPSGFATSTDYWVVQWDPVNFTFQLSASIGGTAIVPGSNTSSTITRFAALIAMSCR